MAITSLNIIKKSVNVWVFHDNEMPSGENTYANVYSDIVRGDFLTFGNKTGQIIYKQIPYTIITYTDETDPSNNFTPTSALALHTYLLNDGFFGDSSGGGEGATTLLELTDALFANYFGRAGQALVVGDEENGFTTEEFYNVRRFQDLSNVLITNLLPGKFIATSNITTSMGYSTGLIQADIDQVINTPIPVDVFRVVQKGVVYDSGTGTYLPNQEPFLKEPGDICEGVSSTDGRSYTLEYVGGDESLLESYKIRSSTKGGIVIEPTT